MCVLYAEDEVQGYEPNDAVKYKALSHHTMQASARAMSQHRPVVIDGCDRYVYRDSAASYGKKQHTVN